MSESENADTLADAEPTIETGALEPQIELPEDRDAGSADLPSGEPDWAHPYSMGFDGWYFTSSYWPHINYEDDGIYVVNNGAYSITVQALGSSGHVYEEIGLETDQWGAIISDVVYSEIRVDVDGSAQDEHVSFDGEKLRGHEVWMSGPVLNADYWLGVWK